MNALRSTERKHWHDDARIGKQPRQSRNTYQMVSPSMSVCDESNAGSGSLAGYCMSHQFISASESCWTVCSVVTDRKDCTRSCYWSR